MPQPQASLLDILPKIRSYCAYRDRCCSETREKLFSFGLGSNDVEEVVTTLIEEGFLNEQRFANSFVRGHFYQKKWGKVRIMNELRKRSIEENLILSALAEIDEMDYRSTMLQLADRKQSAMGGEPQANRPKIINYLVRKGYELPAVLDCLRWR